MTNFKTTLLILLNLIVVSNSFSQNDALTNGDHYYLISVDDISAFKISSKVVADFRPNENTNQLYIWDNTYLPGVVSGPNSFGDANATWISVVVNNVGWSGAGFYSSDAYLLDKLATVTANPDNYYFHISVKCSNNKSFLFGMDGQSNIRFAVGSTTYSDGGTNYQPITDFPRDGEWHTIEIPMAALKQMGLLYSVGMGSKNVFWFLCGGVAGVALEMDGIFIYEKKLNTAIDNESVSDNFIVTRKTVCLPNASEPLELYNAMGVKIKSTHESTMGIDDLAKGIYIVRSGKNTIKIRL
ncbi:MAG: hypothetical protein QM800_16055 [Paludibacter sp.]